MKQVHPLNYLFLIGKISLLFFSKQKQKDWGLYGEETFDEVFKQN